MKKSIFIIQLCISKSDILSKIDGIFEVYIMILQNLQIIETLKRRRISLDLTDTIYSEKNNLEEIVEIH